MNRRHDHDHDKCVHNCNGIHESSTRMALGLVAKGLAYNQYMIQCHARTDRQAPSRDHNIDHLRQASRVCTTTTVAQEYIPHAPETLDIEGVAVAAVHLHIEGHGKVIRCVSDGVVGDAGGSRDMVVSPVHPAGCPHAVTLVLGHRGCTPA